MIPQMDSYRTAQLSAESRSGQDPDTAFFGAPRARAGTVALECMAARMAHDFNNVLTTIAGLASLVEKDLESGIVRSGDIRGIREAARRARSLTSDLLAFSRHASRDCRSHSSEEIEILAFLESRQEEWQAGLGDALAFEILSCSNPVSVRASSGVLTEVFRRILQNAREFVPEGGKVRLGVSRRALGEAFCADRGLVAGDYAALRVSDDGPGMAAETAARAFDPYFSTRAHRGARGLGLAVAHGLTRDAGGHIELSTRPGHGCTFTIFLPIARESPPENAAPVTFEGKATEATLPAPEATTAVITLPTATFPLSPNPSAPVAAVPSPRVEATPQAKDGLIRGQETILVVEDEPMVRELVTRSLGYLGYKVIKACNGQEGFDLATAHAGEIAIIFSDIVMPRMNGPEMVQRLRDSGFHFRVLFTTGFTENKGITLNGELREGVNILPKPYATKDLSTRIREILDAA